MGQKPNLTAFTSKIQVFCRPELTKGWPKKMNFDKFQMQKWGFLTVRGRKEDKKNGLMNLVFLLPSWFMVHKLSKIVSFVQFFADISKTSKAVIAIFVYASECSRFAFLENGVGYNGMI